VEVLQYVIFLLHSESTEAVTTTQAVVTTQSAVTTQAISAMFLRLQQSCINDQIDGRLQGYVDDFCGCSSTSFSDADQDIANKIGESLTQSAEDKHEYGRSVKV
jgi:hypothetical protein